MIRTNARNVGAHRGASLSAFIATGLLTVAAALGSCGTSPRAEATPALGGQPVRETSQTAGTVKTWPEGEQEPLAAKSPEGAATESPSGESASATAVDPPPDSVGPANSSPPTPPSDTADPKATPKVAPAGLREVFPFVRVDAAAKLVEVDAEVPAYAYFGENGVVYLEVMVCTRDTREHEAVLVTGARASDVHAALLMIGLNPGAPGGWEWKEKTILPIAPRGDSVRVSFAVERDGVIVEEPATRWVYNASSGKTLEEEAKSDEGFVFGGSAFVNKGGGERYAADGAGTLVGLATFGTETIAWKRVMSPEASVEDPVWAARRDVQPKAGTRVVVRLRGVN